MAVASARTCYSGNGVILPREVSKDEKAIALRDRVASSTLQAGHLTTRQHAHFVFAISGISRHCIWSFLHSHPFYNSEQVSQRYVRVKRGAYVMPPFSEEQKALYSGTVEAQMAAYEKLIGLLRFPLSADYYERFPARKKTPEKWAGAIDKRAYEVARYVLGVGASAHLYHTISALTLLRYAKLVNLFETGPEQRVLVTKMIECVLALDPLFEKELDDPLPLDQTLEYRCVQEFWMKRQNGDNRFVAEFDRELGTRVSKLVSFTSQAEQTLAKATRVALGRTSADLSDEQAIDLVCDPKSNPVLADSLNGAAIDRLSQVLHHVHFTFQKKLSHTADSQDQRHRTVPSSHPLLLFQYGGVPDYITPFGISQSSEATEVFNKSMEQSFAGVNQLLEAGVERERAFYLLPNAFPIRMMSSGDLLSLQHKWKMRSCYNAQEEIFRATIDEISQLREQFPLISKHLRAPCYARLRAGTKPYCPEGDRFCGLPVWKYEIDRYERKSL